MSGDLAHRPSEPFITAGGRWEGQQLSVRLDLDCENPYRYRGVLHLAALGEDPTAAQVTYWPATERSLWAVELAAPAPCETRTECCAVVVGAQSYDLQGALDKLHAQVDHIRAWSERLIGRKT